MTHAGNSHTSPSIVFVGVHMEARAPFRYLVDRGCNVLGLVTLRQEGMARVSAAIDLAPMADQAHIPVFRIGNINESEAVAWIQEKAPTLLLVVGWTQLLKPALLRVPTLACLGFHASLLPKGRGRAPVNWALINGETVTGNTMIVLEPEADSGDIVAQRTIPITEQDDCRTVYEKVGQTEVEMLDEVLPMIGSGALPRRKQDDTQATVMPKRRPEDGIINWNRSSRQIYDWVRALTDPYPGAFSFLNGHKLWIWATDLYGDGFTQRSHKPGEVTIDSAGWPWVSTANGWIKLITVQREGGPKTSGQAAAGAFLPAGGVLGRATEAAT